jgi:hypothetical protein
MPTGVDYRDIVNTKTKETRLIGTEELVLAELSLLLNMDKHTLFFGNNMGLDLSKYLHLTNKVAVFNLVRADIEDFFKVYRRATLVDISMRFDESRLKLVIDLTLNIAGNITRLPLEISN